MTDPDLFPQFSLARLFHDVQLAALFGDSKSFADAIPRRSPKRLLAEYLEARDGPGFELSRFVQERFILEDGNENSSDTAARPPVEVDTVEEHIRALWEQLTRDGTDEPAHSSRIAIPGRYVVPGGRFREIYYWDSYFTMLGLIEHGRCDLAGDMVDVFSTMIERFGFIPNGNRTYYLSRSQPPFFSSMVSLLDERCDGFNATRFLPKLEAEYTFWMRGSDRCRAKGDREERCVNVDGSGILNRYWDDLAAPRDESYREDYLLGSSLEDPEQFYRNTRAACESGWDFSSRWLGPDQTLESIRTTRIVPVDLNCLLVHLEETIAALADRTGDTMRATEAREAATERRELIRDLFWDARLGCFTDFDLETGATTGVVSAAVCYPLFFGIASGEQASQVAELVERRLLEPGGLNTTTSHTGQQWDAPNGWAPLQWIAASGLHDYGYSGIAKEIASRWNRSVESMYARTGKIVEKYDVEQPDRPGGGGEYPTQDGFGWTNGVYLAFKRFLSESKGGVR